MARDGSGTYTLPSGNPVATQTPISSTVHNATVEDMAAAHTQALSKDGQTAATADLPMGGFKHTNVAEATLANQYATLGQAQSNVSGYVVDSSVTPNTITINPSPPVTALIAGQHWIVRLNTTNTGATTAIISGLTGKSVFLPGPSTLRAGYLRFGHLVMLVYDGTQLIATNVSAPGLTALQIIATTGTWTKPAGLVLAEVWCVGGGGGGGAGGGCGGGGGGATAFSLIPATSLAATVAIFVGAGGVAGVNSNVGAQGGTTSFSGHVSAGGGLGGGGEAGGGSGYGGLGGSGLLGQSGPSGSPGSHGIRYTDPNLGVTVIHGGNGGNSLLGMGGRGGLGRTGGSPVSIAPEDGSLFGGGGGGAVAANPAGDGAKGVCIVREYGI